MLANNVDCQGCSGHVWQVGLISPLGRLYLCADCASWAISDRDSNNKMASLRYSRLLDRVFKKVNHEAGH